MSRLLRNIFMFVVYAYLYIPIIILVTNSFNEDRYGLSWKGFSWNWYERLFNNDTLIQAAFHSVTIAFFAATLATIVGGLTAIALYRYRFRGKQAVSGMLFIVLPSGRRLCYIKPKIGENKFGGESVTYEGVGTNKKWERIESYGPKFVENIVQAISRDILCHAMRTLPHCFIVGHVHDELIIETPMDADLTAICEQMGRTPKWIDGLLLRADGYETAFYKKD